jgi:hypothetical protein
MATQTSGSRIVEDERPIPRTPGLFVVTSFAVILGILLTSQIVNRWLAFEVEEGPDGSSVALLSPIGKFPLRKTPAGNRSLLVAIYPDSNLKEEASLDWTERPGTPAKSRRQLTVLTYQTGASLEQLDSWYQEKLGGIFGRNKDWTAAGNEETADWMRRVESHSQPEAITFRQELQHESSSLWRNRFLLTAGTYI